jgi:kanamycin kinase
MSAGPPRDAAPAPASVRTLAGNEPIRAVWHNELGGITFEIGDARFVKWTPRASPLDPWRERARLLWAHAYVPVPRVLAHGEDDDGRWLVTEALPGENAVSERWLAAPALAVTAIGAGLRAFHDALPVATCPFSWSIEDRLADIRTRARAGRILPERWHEDHRETSVDEAIAILERPPPIDMLVVCHGDTCAPNTLVDDNGRCTGHVDLGALGVADRWADLAIATWSTTWNYGPGPWPTRSWESTLLAAYGIAEDPERTRYYRLLYDLGP